MGNPQSRKKSQKLAKNKSFKRGCACSHAAPCRFHPSPKWSPSVGERERPPSLRPPSAVPARCCSVGPRPLLTLRAGFSAQTQNLEP